MFVVSHRPVEAEESSDKDRVRGLRQSPRTPHGPLGARRTPGTRSGHATVRNGRAHRATCNRTPHGCTRSRPGLPSPVAVLPSMHHGMTAFAPPHGLLQMKYRDADSGRRHARAQTHTQDGHTDRSIAFTSRCSGETRLTRLALIVSSTLRISPSALSRLAEAQERACPTEPHLHFLSTAGGLGRWPL